MQYNGTRNIVDGTWVRRWSNRKTRTLKCRLCSRGFLDKQKASIDKLSSTASRLSHRLALSLAVQWELCIEAWDISTAFLLEVPRSRCSCARPWLRGAL